MNLPPTPPARPAPAWEGSLALLILALAFAVRTYHLGVQSLWFDEGFSAHLALGSLGAVFTEGSLDPHPPLYYTLLWLWRFPAGGGEFALRFPSAVAGVLAVVLLYRLGRDLAGGTVGLVAALLAAVNPFLAYYGQEVRAYSFMVMLSLLATVLLLRAGQGSVRWRWYAVAAAALLASHYFAAFTVATHALWLVLGRPGRAVLLAWLRSVAVAVALFAPWLLYAGLTLAGYQTLATASVPPLQALREIAVAFSTGVVPAGSPLRTATLVMGAAMPLGLVALAWRRHGGVAAMLLTGVLTPLAGLLLVSLLRPTFNPRYVLMALPYVFLLGAATTSLPGRRSALLGLGAGLLLAVPSLPPLRAYFTDPALARDDWRSATAFVDAHAGPGDIFVFNAAYVQDVFDYYAHGPQPRLGVARTGHLDGDGAAAVLNQTAGLGRRFWLVLWQDEVSDPGAYLPGTAEAQATVVQQYWSGPIRAFAYDAPSGEHPFKPLAPAEKLAANLADEIALEGYSVDRLTVKPGDTLNVTLYWRSMRAVHDDYRGFVHLLGKDMLVYGQQDKVSIGFYHPTSTWKPGETLRDTYQFQVLPETPPGDYTLEAGMYTFPAFERRPVLGENGAPATDSVSLPVRVRVQAH